MEQDFESSAHASVREGRLGWKYKIFCLRAGIALVLEGWGSVSDLRTTVSSQRQIYFVGGSVRVLDIVVALDRGKSLVLEKSYSGNLC